MGLFELISQMAVSAWLIDAQQGGRSEVCSAEELLNTDLLFMPCPPLQLLLFSASQALALLLTNGSFGKFASVGCFKGTAKSKGRMRLKPKEKQTERRKEKRGRRDGQRNGKR